MIIIYLLALLGAILIAYLGVGVFALMVDSKNNDNYLDEASFPERVAFLFIWPFLLFE